MDLLEGHVTVNNLPEVWQERFRQNFGIAPESNRDGVLQEMNWYCGRIGGLYQHFTLGNIMSAMWFELATSSHPAITTEMERGEFGTLRNWLTQQIYIHGRKFTIPELVERVAGEPLSTEAYICYLKKKYGELYGLSFD